MTAPVIVQPPAKLNLGLRVIRRRADGYHDLLTTFLAVDWTDRLTISPADRGGGRDGSETAPATADSAAASAAADSMTCSDPSIPADESNLCLRAVRALRSWAAESPAARDAAHGTVQGADAGTSRAPGLVPLRIVLEKRIPAGSGLGGGSSDAAATLKAAAEIWGLDVPDEAMISIAAGLGADVPFFLDPSPQLASGIGDRLRPLTARPGLPMEHILIAVPDVYVSTAEAYTGVTPRPPEETVGAAGHDVPETDGRRLAAAFVATDPAVWRRDLVNDFEASIFERYPQIGRLKASMLDAGALHASMSGSGSAVFGIFRTGEAAAAAESRLGASDGLRLKRTRALT